MEPEVATQQIAERAAKTGSTPEKTRDELIKEEVVLDYTGVVSARRQGAAMVGPEPGKLCWPALICTNPHCPGKGKDGKPFLFAYRYKAVTVGPDGKPDWSANAVSTGVSLNGVCPACFKTNTAEAYRPPEERQRFQEITRRIAKKNAEISKITSGGRLLTSQEYGEYKKLLDEQADQPVYYLCE